MNNNPEVFEGTNFKDILREIHQHSAFKRESITSLMDSLTALIKTPNDAATVIPAVRDLLEVAVKNDEHLVKIAVIVQRLITSAQTTGGSIGQIDSILSQAERDSLLKEVKKVQEEAEQDALGELKLSIEQDEDVMNLSKKVEKVKAKVKKSR